MELPVSLITVPIMTANVQLHYPQVIGLPNPTVQQKINQTIFRQVYAIIYQQGYYENPTRAQMVGSYEVKTNERGILSMSFTNYTYFYPAANGLTIIRSLTFDTHTGETYSLQSLFKEGSDYITPISADIQAQIKERQIQLTTEFTTIRPDQDYYIADKALVIYFQMYEITPRPYGLPAFPISVYALENIIDEQGPLGKMLPNG
ncbi:DUF3298 and DUF4163 domain-containing protein [Heliophilum fasciatum]|uniref:Uncharacterized protein DUF4163 n=1 Tax=Heliophilum fasciatum TaxID=35700 RepID=A0A4R2RVR3_9FIRM|nr:DUF3298 and DUF4163 domain-containing protein [Heliophilum fasciatum]MCW2276962.1 hypothetical protein [Heliophilum fasciatum]TCP68512.1 uncharacterized protein DUF4163 [Heliophilum fasciatum]